MRPPTPPADGVRSRDPSPRRSLSARRPLPTATTPPAAAPVTARPRLPPSAAGRMTSPADALGSLNRSGNDALGLEAPSAHVAGRGPSAALALAGLGERGGTAGSGSSGSSSAVPWGKMRQARRMIHRAKQGPPPAQWRVLGPPLKEPIPPLPPGLTPRAADLSSRLDQILSLGTS